MRYASFLMLVLLSLASCGKTEWTEVRDDQGNLVEKFQRNKKDFAKEGQYLAFFPEGEKEEEATYVRDTLDGVRTIFYRNGKPQIVEQYKMGLFEGPYKAYYENGQLEIEGNYLFNSMTGIWKRYYENGQLMEEVIFVDNQENGPFVEYHENGKLKARGTYREGDFEHGSLELYDENGELEKKMDCDKGICRTVWSRDTLSPTQ